MSSVPLEGSVSIAIEAFIIILTLLRPAHAPLQAVCATTGVYTCMCVWKREREREKLS